jgi:hypothetical protein
MLAIEFIAFACYPPRSETSHDGGIVGLLYLRQLIVNFYCKEILLRRRRGHRMFCKCRCLYRHVEVQSVLCLSCVSNIFISGTVGSYKKMVPNKGISSLDWEIVKV